MALNKHIRLLLRANPASPIHCACGLSPVPPLSSQGPDRLIGSVIPLPQPRSTTPHASSGSTTRATSSYCLFSFFSRETRRRSRKNKNAEEGEEGQMGGAQCSRYDRGPPEPRTPRRREQLEWSKWVASERDFRLSLDWPLT
jgi:hypothetical protein